MEKHENANLLRIFIGESDKLGHQPLYEAIVFEAKKTGMAGATVTRAVMGYGANSRVHTAKLFEISTDLPMIVEIVDTFEKISSFVQKVEKMFENAKSGGLITLEAAKIITYRSSTNE